MQPDAFGRLNFDGFDTDDQRMVSECSDACGCSMNCSRRQLQRGQKFGVVFYYEDECRQFGLRALKPIKRGQFILEYTGQKLEVISMPLLLLRPISVPLLPRHPTNMPPVRRLQIKIVNKYPIHLEKSQQSLMQDSVTFSTHPAHPLIHRRPGFQFDRLSRRKFQEDAWWPIEDNNLEDGLETPQPNIQEYLQSISL
ncbi:hypothetical protein B9Z55_007610 [Caenorhabditis nigoni]|uniref:SET domain-containing protein n=1 Tax=Caenorhabditis nigoni TaxID=1611254 RepID=A0A2G5VAC7_9PELO|nr:hypothetical protein B9Z55_007610 [Caenorhabditis nigoni]